MPLLFFLPLLAAVEIFLGAFYPVYNVVLLFLILSSVHNLFNKRIMIENMALVDIGAFMSSVILVYICGQFHIGLYSNTMMRGVLILICLNQLFMFSRYNYKERVLVRKDFY